MKKYIALLCAVLVLVSLVGCGEDDATPTTEQAMEIRHGDFYENFLEILEPISDQYEILELPLVEYNEAGDTSQAIVLTDVLTGDSYHLRISYDADGYILSVHLDGDKGKYTDVHFSLLSYYVYTAMGFPEVEADSFYDEYNLLTPEPDGLTDLPGCWTASADTFDDSIQFVIFNY